MPDIDAKAVYWVNNAATGRRVRLHLGDCPYCNWGTGWSSYQTLIEPEPLSTHCRMMTGLNASPACSEPPAGDRPSALHECNQAQLDERGHTATSEVIAVEIVLRSSQKQ